MQSAFKISKHYKRIQLNVLGSKFIYFMNLTLLILIHTVLAIVKKNFGNILEKEVYVKISLLYS